GSSATRRIWARASGRLPSAIGLALRRNALVSLVAEGLELVHQRSVELGRGRLSLQDPPREVLVGVLQQRLEPVECGRDERRDMPVRERPQNEVRLLEA